jgi:hypothetical protein
MDLARQMPERKIDDPRLEEAVSRLVNALHPRAIILFGSRARGIDPKAITTFLS